VAETYNFLVDTYETERLKTLSVWSMFADGDLGARPHAVDRRGRSFLEQMVHQCVSENLWFCNILGIDVDAPPLPDEETRLAFLHRYADDSARRTEALRQQEEDWWSAAVAFFEVERSRAWVLTRRLAHTAHHRGQLSHLLRALGRDLHSTYGPTADTGGLPATGAPTIYAYADVDELLEAETRGGNAAPLPKPTGDVTERPEVNASRFDQQMSTSPSGDDLAWHAPGDAPLELGGFPWFEQDRIYRRLPAAPPEPLPEAVDGLAGHTAGGVIRLRSNSRHVAVRVELAGPAGMNHMPATGQCGFDVYVGPPGRERFAGIAKYDHSQLLYSAQLFAQPEPQWRDLTLHFPLYQGVRRVEVGLDVGARVEASTPRAIRSPIVFYGTSITQGGCAARPGMAYPAILSRRLQAASVNLGFSGSGKGEPEVARSIGLIDDCSLFVLDYDANCPDAAHLTRTLPVFMDILRQRHPSTPILVVSRPPTAGEAWSPAAISRRQERSAAQRQVVELRADGGDTGLHFLDGGGLLGGDDFDECTVDGTHPTDLGFQRMADGLEPVIRQLLGLT
jgi:uncharacterized damage-inducible protein DinB